MIDGRPIRALMLCHYFPKPGNPLMGPWALAQAQALRRAGVDLTVVSFTSWIPRLLGRLGVKPAWALCPRTHDWNGLEVLYPRWAQYPSAALGRFSYRDPRLQERLCWRTAHRALDLLVREKEPDVVFTHHSLYNGCMARRLKERYGLPYFITEHDLDEVTSCHEFPARRAVMGAATLDTDACIVFSRRMEEELRRLFPAVNTRLIRNGSDPLPAPLRDRPRPPEIRGKLVVATAAVFYERKGVPLLVRAFARVAPKHPDAVLRIAGGGGTDGPNVEAAIREAALGDRVQLLGLVPPERAKQEMVWSDVFASIGWNEPFATVCIEAASAGRPIRWASDGGIGEVLRDGVDGVAVEPRSIDSAAAALDRLLGDAATRERMGRASRELFDRTLTWDANAAAVVRLFQDALARKHSGDTQRAATPPAVAAAS
jgi:glycosyltransferase involved in cell wall biosynthesis